MYMYIYLFICIFCFKFSEDFVFFNYIGHRSTTMEGNNSLPHKKSRKQIQQVIKLIFLTLYNVIELTYDCNRGRGCKTNGHSHHRFDALGIS
jgi:hypothetical protein